MKLEIFEVKQLIDQLKSIDTDFQIFGARSHRYDIGPTLSNTELLNFEKKYDIVLPEDYRLYLQLVGDGSGRQPRPYPYNSPWVIAGAGPGYGIYPLSETSIGDRLSQPFPFYAEIKLPPELPDDDWIENVPGALEISTRGCTTHTHLIVKGATVGTIWEGCDYSYFTPTTRTFIQWIRDWAEKELQVFAKKPLVKRLKIGMTKAEVISVTDEDWVERMVSDRRFFESSSIRVQLELNENDVVTVIDSYF